jgi:hypothetical protein
VVQTNFDLLSDIFMFIGLTCLLPLLEIVHTLIKCSQQKNVFVHDYMTSNDISSRITNCNWLNFFTKVFCLLLDKVVKCCLIIKVEMLVI